MELPVGRTASQPLHVNFIIDPRKTRWPDIERLSAADIADNPSRFVGGRNSWIAQGFVRLRPMLESLGWKVTAGARYIPGSVSIAHRDDANAVLTSAFRTFLVVVRADRQPAMACDLAIVQNAIDPMSHERFMPLWPQPGLTPRKGSRGTTLKRIAYMGRLTSPPAWFADPSFHGALKARGVDFEVRTQGWDRYDDVDLVVAARDELPLVLANKPATKLYNGWLAGVPVLAAPEPAYEELRRSPLDYLRIEGPHDVLAAVDDLQAQPALYDAMVANGQRRARAFSVESIAQRWCELLQDEVAPRARAMTASLPGRALWFAAAMARQKVLSKRYRWMLDMERRGYEAATPAPGPIAVRGPAFEASR